MRPAGIMVTSSQSWDISFDQRVLRQAASRCVSWARESLVYYRAGVWAFIHSFQVSLEALEDLS
jgi:hypothetical protein